LNYPNNLLKLFHLFPLVTSCSSDPGHSSPGSESSQDSTTPTNLNQGVGGGRSEQPHHWQRLGMFSRNSLCS